MIRNICANVSRQITRSSSFQYVSDLHLEFHCNHVDGIEEAHNLFADMLGGKRVSADNLILAGDIGNLSCKKQIDFLSTFLEWCLSRWHHVIYVPGNHEYYGTTIANGSEILKQLDERHRDAGLRVLNPGRTEVDGVMIFGATLWTQIPKEESHVVKHGMGDFTHIDNHSVLDHNTLFKNQIDLLRAWCKGSSKPIIIVTHHAPDRDIATIPQANPFGSQFLFPLTDLSAGFGTNLKCILSEFNTKDIAFWVYGHTHMNRDTTLKIDESRTIRVICNQKGYISENMAVPFDPNKNFVVETEQ